MRGAPSAATGWTRSPPIAVLTGATAADAITESERRHLIGLWVAAFISLSGVMNMRAFQISTTY